MSRYYPRDDAEALEWGQSPESKTSMDHPHERSTDSDLEIAQLKARIEELELILTERPEASLKRIAELENKILNLEAEIEDLSYGYEQ